MLLNQYAEKSLLCNVSVNGKTSEDNVYVYRGDMVIEEGEIADSQGRRHPPKSVVKQAVTMGSESKLDVVAGAVDNLEFIPDFIAKYGTDFSEKINCLFYVSNIKKPMIVDVDGISTTVLPHDEGAVWTMLMDDLRLEKSDFKGQSAEDKVITMFEALSDYKPGAEVLPFDQAIKNTVEIKKEARGPV